MSEIIGGKDGFTFLAWDTVMDELCAERDRLSESDSPPRSADNIRGIRQVTDTIQLLRDLWEQSK